ncbi:MAG: hypothetical protein ACOX6S_14750 [Clostridia bacterium]
MKSSIGLTCQGSEELIKDKGYSYLSRPIPFGPKWFGSICPCWPDLRCITGIPASTPRILMAYACARENKLKMLSGTDFHQVYDLDTRGGVEISERIEKPEEFVALIRQDRIAGLIQTQ